MPELKINSHVFSRIIVTCSDLPAIQRIILYFFYSNIKFKKEVPKLKKCANITLQQESVSVFIQEIGYERRCILINAQCFVIKLK